MPKFESFSEKPKPKRTAEEIRRSNAELRRQLEELKSGQKIEVPHTSKPEREQSPTRSEKNREKERARKLSFLHRVIAKFILGAALLEAGALGSWGYTKIKEVIELQQTEKIDAEKEVKKQTKKLTEELEEPKKKEKIKDEIEAEKIGEKEKELIKIFGEYSPFRTEKNWQSYFEKRGGPTTEEKKQQKLETLTVFGAEISTNILREYLNTFPLGWVEEITYIGQSNEYEQMSYKGVKGSALASCAKVGKQSIITFYIPTRSASPAYVMHSLSHEIAHANDWSNDEEMSYKERVDLLYDISQRVFANDRFLSSYVESIENPELGERNFQRATEYWAEISAQYFSDPTKLNIKDYAIVDSQVRKADPNYNALVSSNQRAEILKAVLAQKLQKVG